MFPAKVVCDKKETTSGDLESDATSRCLNPENPTKFVHLQLSLIRVMRDQYPKITNCLACVPVDANLTWLDFGFVATPSTLWW